MNFLFALHYFIQYVNFSRNYSIQTSFDLFYITSSKDPVCLRDELGLPLPPHFLSRMPLDPACLGEIGESPPSHCPAGNLMLTKIKATCKTLRWSLSTNQHKPRTLPFNNIFQAGSSAGRQFIFK